MIETLLSSRGVESLCTSHMLQSYLEGGAYPHLDQTCPVGMKIRQVLPTRAISVPETPIPYTDSIFRMPLKNQLQLHVPIPQPFLHPCRCIVTSGAVSDTSRYLASGVRWSVLL